MDAARRLCAGPQKCHLIFPYSKAMQVDTSAYWIPDIVGRKLVSSYQCHNTPNISGGRCGAPAYSFHDPFVNSFFFV
jgi:hypothetical protein